jgi:hypothetical protein
MRTHTQLLIPLSVLLLMLPRAAGAQDATALAKQTQNPVSSLISFPLQANWDFGLGDRDAVGTLLNIQPVVPFGINPSTNIILRVIMPLTSQPGADGMRVNGMGDVVATAFFSPANSGRIIWGAGPVFLLPAATNSALGSEKFGIGPSVVALTQPGPWTIWRRRTRRSLPSCRHCSFRKPERPGRCRCTIGSSSGRTRRRSAVRT